MTKTTIWLKQLGTNQTSSNAGFFTHTLFNEDITISLMFAYYINLPTN